MNFFTITIMLISITIIDATTLIRSQNTLDDKILEKTCLGKYTGTFHSFVYFSENSTSQDYYVIRTPWLITYPGRIEDELVKSNMIIIDKKKTKKCGWTTIAHVKQAGISTGTIYQFKNENTICKDTALEILSDIYPSLEITFTVIGFFIIFCILFLLCGAFFSMNI